MFNVYKKTSDKGVDNSRVYCPVSEYNEQLISCYIMATDSIIVQYYYFFSFLIGMIIIGLPKLCFK